MLKTYYPTERHKCEGVESGDWIIYTCPKCDNYMRKDNIKTGEMVVTGSSAEISHWGSNITKRVHEDYFNRN
jgi:hypothetical protein